MQGRANRGDAKFQISCYLVLRSHGQKRWNVCSKSRFQAGWNRSQSNQSGTGGWENQSGPRVTLMDRSIG